MPPDRREPADAAAVRVLLMVAAACGVLSLGLKWGSAVADIWMPGSFVPGICVSVLGSDGYYSMECGPDYWGLGTMIYGSAGAVGAQTAARVFVVAVAIAAAVALRRGSRVWARAALITAAAGLLLSGLAARPGPLAFLTAAILLAFALRRAGLIGEPSAAALPSSSADQQRPA